MIHYGQWLNPDGYRDVTRDTVHWPWPKIPSPWHVTMHEVTLDPVGPLTYQMMADSPVVLIQMSSAAIRSDGGSIPPFLRAYFPHDECARSYYMHDSACREHGLYFYDGVGLPFRFCPMPSVDVHRLLREMFMAEKILWAQRAGLKLASTRLADYERRAWAVYAAVRVFGPRWEITKELT